MPTYDYRCEANNEIYEVKHAMSASAATWGELCELGGMALDGIPADAPVKKLLNTGGVVKSSSLKNPDAPPCMTGSGCPGGSCGV
jgi:predicted nucleic acid-binding Zn ribbon protein